MAKAPDRGSFPLDHFHECDKEATKYSECVIKHQLMPKRCRDQQIKYLNCRMNSGLMEKQEMDKLGFVKENSWETEQSEKKYLLKEINEIKNRAWQAALQKQKMNSKNEKPPTNLPV